MQKLFFAVLLLPLLFTAAQEDFVREDGVVVLKDSNYHQALSKFDYILIEFYAPWCGHCKRLAPEYSRAAQILNEGESKVTLAKLDATTETNAAASNNLEGYPTLKFFVKGKEHAEYLGERTANAMVKWLQGQLELLGHKDNSKTTDEPAGSTGTQEPGTSIATLSSVEELQKILNLGVTLVVHFGPKHGFLWDIFREAAGRFSGETGLGFAVTFFESVHKAVGVSGQGEVIIFRQAMDKRKTLSPPYDAVGLYNFILDNQHDVVIQISSQNAPTLFGTDPKPLIILLRGASPADDAAEKQLLKASEVISGKIRIAVANYHEAVGRRLVELLGLEEEELPKIRILEPDEVEFSKFALTKDISAQNIIEFCEDYKQGKLKKIYKSEEVPIANVDPVKVVVGKTFQQMVMDPSKDVLIEFYAPWCGHCKALAPTYESVAKRLRKSPDLRIAKIDLTENEIEGLRIAGYPTIYFYLKDKKNEPIEYMGDRTERSIVNFIKEHATTTIIDVEEDNPVIKPQEKTQEL